MGEARRRRLAERRTDAALRLSSVRRPVNAVQILLHVERTAYTALHALRDRVNTHRRARDRAPLDQTDFLHAVLRSGLAATETELQQAERSERLVLTPDEVARAAAR